MRHLALIVLAAVTLPGAALAQTYGQTQHYSQHGHAPTPYGHPGLVRGTGYGDPRAYRAPAHTGPDRGGRYGYSTPAGQWTRRSSPPGRGYHDVYGYNDDRAPRAAHSRSNHSRRTDCNCGHDPYLRDR